MIVAIHGPDVMYCQPELARWSTIKWSCLSRVVIPLQHMADDEKNTFVEYCIDMNTGFLLKNAMI